MRFPYIRSLATVPLSMRNTIAQFLHTARFIPIQHKPAPFIIQTAHSADLGGTMQSPLI